MSTKAETTSQSAQGAKTSANPVFRSPLAATLAANSSAESTSRSRIREALGMPEGAALPQPDPPQEEVEEELPPLVDEKKVTFLSDTVYLVVGNSTIVVSVTGWLTALFVASIITYFTRWWWSALILPPFVVLADTFDFRVSYLFTQPTYSFANLAIIAFRLYILLVQIAVRIIKIIQSIDIKLPVDRTDPCNLKKIDNTLATMNKVLDNDQLAFQTLLSKNLQLLYPAVTSVAFTMASAVLSTVAICKSEASVRPYIISSWITSLCSHYHVQLSVAYLTKQLLSALSPIADRLYKAITGTFEAQGDDDCSIPAAIKAMGKILLTTLGYTIKEDSKPNMKSIQNLRTILGTVKDAQSVGKWSCAFLKESINYCYSAAFGVPLLTSRDQEVVRQAINWISDVRDILCVPNAMNSIVTYTQNAQAILRLEAQGNKIAVELLKHGLTESNMSAFYAAHKMLNEFVALSRSTLGNRTRVRPVGIRLHGGSNSGKSVLTEILKRDIYRILFDRELHAGHTYIKNFGDPFDNAYAGQFFFQCDDFGQKWPKDESADYVEYLINANNTAPFSMNMASLESKGVTFCTSEMFIINTNLDKFAKPGAIASLEAFLNRFPLAYWVSVKARYVYDNGHRRGFKTDLIEKDFGTRVSTGIYQFQAYEPGTAQRLCGPLMSYEDVLADVLKYYLDSRNDHTAFNTSVANMDRIEDKDAQIKNYQKQIREIMSKDTFHSQGDDTDLGYTPMESPENSPPPTTPRHHHILEDETDSEAAEESESDIAEAEESDMDAPELDPTTLPRVRKAPRSVHEAIDKVCDGFLYLNGRRQTAAEKLEQMFAPLKEVPPYLKQIVRELRLQLVDRFHTMESYTNMQTKEELTEHRIYFDKNYTKVIDKFFNLILGALTEQNYSYEHIGYIVNEAKIIQPKVPMWQWCATAKEAVVVHMNRLKQIKDHRERRERTRKAQDLYFFLQMATFKATEEIEPTDWISDPKNKYKLAGALATVAALGAGSYGLYKLYSHYSRPSAQSNKDDPYDDQAKSQIIKGKVSSVERKLDPVRHVTMKAQGNNDQSSLDVAENVVSKNLARYVVVTKAGARGGQCIFIQNRIAVATRHQWTEALSDVDSHVVLTVHKLTGNKTYRIDCAEIACVTVTESDLIVLKFPDTFDQLPNILDHFVGKDELPADIRHSIYFSHYTQTHLFMCREVKNAMYLVQAEYNISGTKNVVKNCLQGTIQTKRGDCGGVYMLSDTRVRRKILAIHIAGNNAEGIGVIISRETIQQALAAFSEMESQGLELPTIESVEEWQSQVTKEDIERIMGEIKPAQLPDTATVETLYGEVPKEFVQHMPGKSEIRRSMIADVILPKLPDLYTPRFPAYLRKIPQEKALYFHEDGTPLTPFEIGTKSIWRSRFTIDKKYESLLHRVAEVILNELPDFDADNLGCRTLTMMEAVNGVKHWECLTDPIPINKSMGFPWVFTHKKEISKFPGKKYFLTFDPSTGLYTPIQELRESVERLMRAAEEGGKYPIIFVLNLKDELREKAKTRVFWAGPCEYLITMRQHFGCFLETMQAKWKQTPYRVGINPHSFDWHWMITEMMRVGERCWPGDYGNFDNSTPYLVLLLACWILVKWYERQGLSQEEIYAKFNILSPCRGAIHIAHDIVLKICGSNPSGEPLTSQINNFVNQIVLLTTIFLISQDEGKHFDLSTWREKVFMNLYGDDNYNSFDRSLNFITMQKLSLKIKEVFGMEYTDAKKGLAFEDYPDSYDIREAEFLKRTPVMDNHGVYHGALRQSSIFDMLMYVRDQDDSEGTLIRQNCETARVEAFHWGPCFYEYLDDCIQTALRACGLQPLPFRKYNDYMQWFMGTSKIDTVIPEFYAQNSDIYTIPYLPTHEQITSRLKQWEQMGHRIQYKYQVMEIPREQFWQKVIQATFIMKIGQSEFIANGNFHFNYRAAFDDGAMMLLTYVHEYFNNFKEKKIWKFREIHQPFEAEMEEITLTVMPSHARIASNMNRLKSHMHIDEFNENKLAGPNGRTLYYRTTLMGAYKGVEFFTQSGWLISKRDAWDEAALYYIRQVRQALDNSSFIAEMDEVKSGPPPVVEAIQTAKTGVISTGLKIIGDLKPALAVIPLVGDVAAVACPIAKVLGEFASTLGYNKPTSVDNPAPRLLETSDNSMLMTGVDPAYKLASVPDNAVSTSSALFADKHDYMKFMNYKLIPACVDTFTITPTSEGLLYDTYLSPTKSVVTRLDANKVVLGNSPSSHLASMFRYWRGSLKFTFQIVTARFISGRIRIVYIPSGHRAPVDIVDGAANFFSVVVDFSGTTMFDVMFPYLNDAEWMISVPWTEVGFNDPLKNQGRNNYGIIQVYMENELSFGTDPTLAKAEVNVWMSCAEDMQFAYPRGLWYQYSNLSSLVVAETETTDLEKRGKRGKEEKRFEAQMDEFQVESPNVTQNAGYALTSFADLTNINVESGPTIAPVYGKTNPFESDPLSSILSRVATFSSNWTTTAVRGTNIRKMNFPQSLIQDNQFLDKVLAQYQYMRAAVQVEIRINSTQFHQGCLLVNWKPYGEKLIKEPNINGNLTQRMFALSQMNHVLLDANCPDTVSFTIPYVSQKNYVDLSDPNDYDKIGTFEITVLNQLIDTSGNNSSLNFSINVRFVNPELAGPTIMSLPSRVLTKFEAQAETASTYNMRDRFRISYAPISEATTTIKQHMMHGENIEDFSSLFHRPTAVRTWNFQDTTGPYSRTNTLALDNTIFATPGQYFNNSQMVSYMEAFMFSRGSIRYRLLNVGSGKRPLIRVSTGVTYPVLSRAFNGSTYDPYYLDYETTNNGLDWKDYGLNGLVLHDFNIRPIFEFELPYYSTNYYYDNWNQTVQNNKWLARATISAIADSATPDSQGKFAVLASFGEDFTVGWFLHAPAYVGFWNGTHPPPGGPRPGKLSADDF